MDKELLKALLHKAVGKFYINDSLLLKIGGLERACVSRIAHYLQRELDCDKEFRDIVVDCEFGKCSVEEGWITKALDITFENEEQERDVCPDLIVHSRGTHTKNLMVVEFKGHWNKKNWDYDKKKLWAFITPRDIAEEKKHFGYLLGVFVELGEQSPKYEFFTNNP